MSLPIGYIKIPAKCPIADEVRGLAGTDDGIVAIEIETGDAVLVDDDGDIVARYMVSVSE